MGGSIGANQCVMRGLVSGRPHHAGSCDIAAMLGHLCRHDLKKRMGSRNLRSFQESVRGMPVIPKVVVDECQIIVEMPISGIVLNSVFDQFDCKVRGSGAGWGFGRKKGPAKLVSGYQMGIKLGGNVQQRPQKLVSSASPAMGPAKVLHHASPINIGQ